MLANRTWRSGRGRAGIPARDRRSAFTLIELLVVIAIIAILAAILFPVFAQAREKARQSACLSNMKQIMLGLHMYTQDYDETFPPERMPNVTNPGGPAGCTWRYALNSYIKNLQVWYCPDDAINAGWSEGYLDGQTFGVAQNNTGARHLSYTYNGSIYNAGGANLGIGLPAVQLPSNEILVVETRFQYPDIGLNLFGDKNAATPTCSNIGTHKELGPSITHNGMMNFGFIDGHVKAMKFLNTITPNAVYGSNPSPNGFLWFDPATRTDWVLQSNAAYNGIKNGCPNAGYL